MLSNVKNIRVVAHFIQLIQLFRLVKYIFLHYFLTF